MGGCSRDAVSWRAVFWVNVLLAALAAVLAAQAEESRDTSAGQRVDWRGLLTGTAALTVFSVFIDRAPHWGWLSVRSAALAWPRFLCCCSCAPNEQARIPSYSWSCSGTVRSRTCEYHRRHGQHGYGGVSFRGSLSLQDQWNLPLRSAGIAFIGPAVALTVARPLAGRVGTSGALPLMAWCLGGGAALLAHLAVAPGLAGYLVAAVLCAGALGDGQRRR